VKVSISGVRGIFGNDLTLQHVLKFSRAFSKLVKKNSCILARDTRASSKIVSETACAALMEQGIDAYNLGVAPTPFACKEARKYGAGLIVTASHNPLEWNGLKFVLEGRGIFENELKEIKKLLDNNFEPRSIAKEVHVTSNYAEELAELVGTIGAKAKVTVDTTGGAASGYASTILSKIGCMVSSINEKFGISSRSPDPIADELRDLRNAVLSSKCDAGFAFDVDGDRLVVVDKNGRKLNPDSTLLLCVSKAIEMGIKEIVVSVDTSRAVEEFASERNCKVHHSKVGEANVVKEMLTHKALAGGEGSSGGFIMIDFNMCRDGLLASAMIASLLGGRKFDECMSIASKYQLIRGKVNVDSNMYDAILDSIVEDLEHECSSVDHLDGAKGIFDDNSWVLIRGSNTEHAMRISIEAKGDKASNLYKRYEQKVREAHEKAKREADN